MGNLFTYEWPCGFQKTEVLRLGKGRLKQPAGANVSAMFARYWRKGQGVIVECPKCRAKALATDGRPGGQVSHGICLPCFARTERDDVRRSWIWLRILNWMGF